MKKKRVTKRGKRVKPVSGAKFWAQYANDPTGSYTGTSTTNTGDITWYYAAKKPSFVETTLHYFKRWFRA